MNDKFKDYEQYLFIDQHNLDEVLVQQVTLYGEICTEFGRATDIYDKAKNDFKVAEAQIQINIRSEFVKEGLKTTDAIITSEVLASKERKEAYKDYHAAQVRLSYIAGLKEAFNQRGWMIRELVHLYGAGYWNEIVTSSGTRDKKGADAENALRDINKQRVSHVGKRRRAE